MKKSGFILLFLFFFGTIIAQTPWGCNVQAIRDSFASRGFYTELSVPSQACNLYFIDSRDRDATLTEADAQTLGAHMAVIDDVTENNAVSAALWAAGYTNGGKVLIGYRRTSLNGAFLPTDGSGVLGYTNWDAGRPDNQLPPCYNAITGCSFCSAPADVYQCNNKEQCVEMTASGAWNDLQCQGRGAKALIKISLCPKITANNDTTICPGATVNINTSITKGSTPYNSYAWSNAATTQNISVTPSVTTTYTMTVTDRYACKDSESVVINMAAGAVASFSIVPAILCENDTATVTLTSAVNPSATYNWNFGGATTISGTTSGPYKIKWTSAGSKTISLTLTGTACGNTPVTQTATVNTKPTATAGRDTTLCNGNPLQLGAAGVAGVNYSWSPATDLSSAAIANPTYTNSAAVPNTQQFILTATANGCATKDTVIINNVASVTTSFTTSAATICMGDTITVTYTGNGNSTQTYNWNFDSGVILSGSGSGPYKIKWTTNGVKNITLAIAGGGCSGATTSQSVTVNSTPTANAGANNTTCSGKSITIGTPTVAGVSYAWSPATYLNNTSIAQPVFSGTNNTGTDIVQSYILTASQSGCQSKDTVVVTLAAAVTSSFTISQNSVCQNIPLQFLYSGNASTAATYNWNFDGGTIVSGSGQGPIEVKWATTSTKNIALWVDEGGCKSDTTIHNITVTTAPLANAGPDLTICSGGNDTLGTPATNATTGYYWTNGIAIQQTNVAQPIVTYRNNSSTPFTETYILTVTENGCQSKDTVNVTFNSNQIATVLTNGSTSKCIGQTATLSVNQPYSNILWTNGLQTDSIIVSTAGSYGYEAADTFGCIFISNSVNVTFSAPPTLVLDSVKNESCMGKKDGKIFFSATGGTPAYFFTWNSGNGTPANNLSAGQYTITVSDLNNCIDSASYTVGLANNLSVDTISIDNPSCFGFADGAIAVNGKNGVAPYTYLWSNSATTATINGLTVGSYSVIVSDSANCSATATISLTEPADIIPTISNPGGIFIGESVLLDLSVSPVGSYSYMWSPSSSLSCNTCEDPTASPFHTITYTITVTDNTNNCKKTTTVIVPVDNTKHYYLPTAFSPNGDGSNDILLLYTNPSAVKEYALSVFNRWGEEIFFTNNLSNGWDGSYNGKAMNNGVYVLQYRITFNDGEVVNHKGSVTIVK